MTEETMSQETLELIALANQRPTEFEMAGKQLAPCPFCGSTDITIFDTGEQQNLFRCLCLRCDSGGPWRDTRLNAIAIWNTRMTA